MSRVLPHNDRWSAALRQLLGDTIERREPARWAPLPSPSSSSSCAPVKRATAVSVDARKGCVVRILDRLSEAVVIVYWCDATACRYGDQPWQLGAAKRAGHCALSGGAIQIGDAVYRPRPARPRPVNAGAMMLASEVERLSPG